MTNDHVEFLTVEQVATRLQYKPATIQGWLREGRLPGKKVGREWRVASNDLAKLLGVDGSSPEEA